MRENKFKVWCKDYNEWEKDECALLPDGIIMQKVMGHWNIIRPKAHIVVFYIGLKDKNGVEIYKGDIVEAESLMTNKIYSFEVTFSEGCYWMAEYEPLYKSNDVIDSDWKNIKVIGNIFENPELLKL